MAKNQAFPLFMAACGWRRPGFFTPSVTFENRASRSPDVFLACVPKKSSWCVDISSYCERVMVMALYGRMHFAQHICCIQTFFLNMALTWHTDMQNTIVWAHRGDHTFFFSSIRTPEINQFIHLWCWIRPQNIGQPYQTIPSANKDVLGWILFDKLHELRELADANISRTWGYTSESMRAKCEAGLCECLTRLVMAGEYGDVWVDISGSNL